MTDATSEIVPRSSTPIVGADVLAYLGLDPRRPESHALVLVAQRYGLDPLLGEVAIIRTKQGPKVYVSRDGLLAIAHRSGQLDGIEVVEQRESDNGWSATVAVHRKDARHPFVYKGGCGKQESQAERGLGAEMALARAERRALKRAFAVPTADAADADVEVIERVESASAPIAGVPQAELDKLTARVDALPDDQRAAFVAWKDDQGFGWPWSTSTVEAMSSELDRIADEPAATPESPESDVDDERPF